MPGWVSGLVWAWRIVEVEERRVRVTIHEDAMTDSLQRRLFDLNKFLSLDHTS